MPGIWQEKFEWKLKKSGRDGKIDVLENAGEGALDGDEQGGGEGSGADDLLCKKAIIAHNM